MFDPIVQSVLTKLERLRQQVADHWQIPAAEALVLAQLVRVGRCVSLCEIGTSYGFSGIHLAAATKAFGGMLHSIDIDPRKTAAARRHFTEAGLIEWVSLYTGDAREVLRTLQPEKPFDFVFMDATKEECFEYLAAVQPKLAKRAILVTDNTITHEQQLATFVAHLRAMHGASSCGVAVGNGFELTVIGG